MKKHKFSQFSIPEIELQIKSVEQRIAAIVADMKEPLEQNFSEQATHLTQRSILNGILNSEREYLQVLKSELDQRRVHS